MKLACSFVASNMRQYGPYYAALHDSFQVVIIWLFNKSLPHRYYS